MRRSLVVLAAGITAAGGPRAALGAIDYTISYFAVPGIIEYIETDLTTLEQEQQEEKVKFSTIGLRLGMTLPQSLGPLVLGIETGFGLPLGGPSFDHRQLVRNPAFSDDRNDTNDGDRTTLKMMSVPLFLVVRRSPPTQVVALGGQVAAGAVILGILDERTESAYNPATDALTSEIVTRDQRTALTFAVEVAMGLVVPVTRDLSMKVYGGSSWMSPVAFTTTRNFPLPTQVHGGTAADPGLKLGGLAFIFRFGLQYGG